MDAITHTLLAAVCMAGCYIWGRYLSKREIVGDVIEKMLMSLEEDGFIKIEEDENGEKELVKVV